MKAVSQNVYIDKLDDIFGKYNVIDEYNNNVQRRNQMDCQIGVLKRMNYVDNIDN